MLNVKEQVMSVVEDRVNSVFAALGDREIAGKVREQLVNRVSTAVLSAIMECTLPIFPVFDVTLSGRRLTVMVTWADDGKPSRLYRDVR